ncbi:MAG: putative lipid II flippase FtsW [Rickettsiales bacterium]|nr:putative lipid II flippase FtsW [Rickettsiales bacterium]
MQFDRTNQSVFAKWWWTVDRPSCFALIFLMCLGAIMVTASSPPVAERIGLDEFYFVGRQQVFLLLALAVMCFVSLLSSHAIRRLAVIMLLASLVLMVLLPFIGFENKGATRWVRLMGMSLQPSEFMKPAFAVVCAWFFSERYMSPGFPGFRIAIISYLVVIGLLLMQPDFGMTVTVSVMFGLQFFLAGVSFAWVMIMIAGGIIGIICAYYFFPHVSKRIDRFLDPSSGDNYQVEKSLEAFQGGGWFGKGPGEGTVKKYIPDSHTDFVFSVAGEEYGIIVCTLIIGVFAFIVLRGYFRLLRETDPFIVLAVAGLLAQFGIQAIINMGVAVNLLPAKGMTLPFLSYGGSSLIAMATGMGMYLALSRKRYGNVKSDLRT